MATLQPSFASKASARIAGSSAVVHVPMPLPYAMSALEPTISAATVALHYGKHHKGYVDNLNRLVPGTPFTQSSLVEVIQGSAGRSEYTAMFNNAAQVWNHDFYWCGLAPGGDGVVPEPLKARIDTSLGYVQALKSELAAAATAQFASGWAWLVLADDRLRVITTANAETPLVTAHRPLLAIDGWEHAYDLDYQNRRAEYVEALIDRLLNWKFAAANLASNGH
jgi:superoxide dismutase, Fe-Mn family